MLLKQGITQRTTHIRKEFYASDGQKCGIVLIISSANKWLAIRILVQHSVGRVMAIEKPALWFDTTPLTLLLWC